MRRALELARRGEGLVEPNPMVGAVVADAADHVAAAERPGGVEANCTAMIIPAAIRINAQADIAKHIRQ